MTGNTTIKKTPENPSQKSNPTPINNWYEDKTEVHSFLDLLNHEGFLLEDVILDIISTSHRRAEIHLGEVFEAAPHRGGGRVEIDLWVKFNNFVFIIEAKRSDYDWVFLQNTDASKDVHLITGPHKQISIHNRVIKEVQCVSKQVIEVLGDKSKPSLIKKQKGNTKKELPIRSAREEYARSALRQVLFNTETLIHNHLNDESWQGPGHRIFVPLIVTNAKLLAGEYNPTNIDADAKLTEINLEPIHIAAFNHAEVLKWGSTYENELEHIGRPARGNQMIDDERFKGSQNKTAFIVSKNHLSRFIDALMNI